MDVVRTSEDGLTREVWHFWSTGDRGRASLYFDEYRMETRPSRRHRRWERAPGKNTYWTRHMGAAGAPAVPPDILLAAANSVPVFVVLPEQVVEFRVVRAR